MAITRSVAGVLSGCFLILAANAALGQDYPTRPIRISTVQLGGGTDPTARLIASGISGPLGQSVIVENRPTILAIENGMKAAPDGYTVLVVGSTLWTQTLLQLKPAWDPINDFAAVTMASSAPVVIVAHPSLPVKSLKELIALAKARPGELNYSMSTIGVNSHLGGELLKTLAGIKIVGIPFKGSVTGLLGGEVHIGFEGTPAVMHYIKSGRLKALAVASAQPSALLPAVPTAAAAGLPGFQSGSAQGVWVPPKTPAPIIRRLNQEIVRFLNVPDTRQKILDSGAEPVGNSPEEFAAFIKADLVMWSKVVKDAGLKPE